MSYIINNERVTNVLMTPALRNLVKDTADALRAQFNYIENAPEESQAAYRAAVMDATMAVAGSFCRNIGDFKVDEFYDMSGYPGTHPIHKPGRNPFIQRIEEAEIIHIDEARNGRQL